MMRFDYKYPDRVSFQILVAAIGLDLMRRQVLNLPYPAPHQALCLSKRLNLSNVKSLQPTPSLGGTSSFGAMVQGCSSGL